MNYLVDANILSEATKVAPNPAVLVWLTRHEDELVVNPMILGELRSGIMALALGRKRRDLEQWLGRVAETIECIPWDAATGLCWAQLLFDLRKGKTMPLLDSMIAATALQHGLTLATRNLHDFRHCGVKLVDPFAV